MGSRAPVFATLFALFWQVYPPRDGRRRGKENAEKLFNKLLPHDQRLCVKAAANYAKDPRVKENWARDPERFIKNGWWKDWVISGAHQCRYKTAGEVCEEVAHAEFEYCLPHLKKRVSHYKTMVKHHIAFPKGYVQPTEEEIEYVQHVANSDPSFASSPHPGAESLTRGGVSGTHLPTLTFGGSEGGDRVEPFEGDQGAEGGDPEAGGADAQWHRDETGDLFAGDGHRS